MFLAPEHKVVLTTTPTRPARSAARRSSIYLDLSNYVNSWKRLGFTDDDVAKPGQRQAGRRGGRLRHARRRSRHGCKEHLDAGADHVRVQVLSGSENLVPALAELAGPLGALTVGQS